MNVWDDYLTEERIQQATATDAVPYEDNANTSKVKVKVAEK
jgi:hypothetical protein